MNKLAIGYIKEGAEAQRQVRHGGRRKRQGGGAGWNPSNNALSSKRPTRSQVGNISPRKGAQENYIGD